LTETHRTGGLGRKTSFRNERAVMKAARYIEANFDRPCTLDDLAAEAGMSPFHFVRVYRRVICQTPYRHLLVTRLRHAAKELRTTCTRVADIAAACGFGDLSTFNASFMRAFGTTPSGYRRRHSAAASLDAT
jgi:AraC family transcriptional regulator